TTVSSSIDDSSEAFHALPSQDRDQLANRLVNVVAYLSDPKIGRASELATGLAQDKPVTGMRADKGVVQNEFTGKAAAEGTQRYKELVDAVDFPDFVSGLIDGVFNSIVDASIRQMEAYSTLLANVAKSVDSFAKDNFTPNQGRDYLTGRFPNLLQTSFDSGQPKLAWTEAAEDGGIAELQQQLGLTDKPDLDEEGGEAELARRGQLEMAKLRQKQLATMVLMGINRIVVTNGSINAKVMVDVKTKDKAERTSTASDFDSNDNSSSSSSFSNRRDGGGWFSSKSSASGSVSNDNSRHRTIVSSTTSTTSTSDIETKAKLSGEVQINFKSETFPLEKLASADEVFRLERVRSAGRGVPAAPGAALTTTPGPATTP
ncbi:MAG: hypothetical protein KC457_31105, partial [Myxococcales bacterium]|nr:hypothetical protein [Myxococcales bacterium]